MNSNKFFESMGFIGNVNEAIEGIQWTFPHTHILGLGIWGNSMKYVPLYVMSKPENQ